MNPSAATRLAIRMADTFTLQRTLSAAIKMNDRPAVRVLRHELATRGLA